jgi:glucokinase
MQGKAMLGLDLGGTKILSGLISVRGDILGDPYTIPTGGEDPEQAIVHRLFAAIEKSLDNAGLKIGDISGIGIGSTGPLDMKQGLILDCPFLPTLKNFPLRRTVRDKFGLPVFLDNDANCFALGEWFFGAGAKYDTLLVYTLGTGLGCGIVINGKVFTGATQHAGEVGTSPYHDETIEDIVSGSGISRIYKNICGREKVAREIADLAFQGDEYALQTWERFGEHLAYAMAWGINMIDPDIVILGGSIANAMELFAPAMERSLRRNICPLPAEKIKVVKAGLGDHAGLIGAACLVLQARDSK